MAKHLKKAKCRNKSIDKYTYLKLGEEWVCPVCVRTFESQSLLQEHMSKFWSSEQFLRLGYHEP